MNYYMLLLFLLTILGLKIYPVRYNDEYLSKECTSCIKGIFILIVFCSHIKTYIPYNPTYDNIAIWVTEKLGQLMVTLFLFYSGYGVYESIKKKKDKYISSIPKNRILKTLFHFDIAVLSFALINYIMGHYNSVPKILTSLIAWSSIGNSDWYIFAILTLYFITYLSFSLLKEDHKKAIVLCSVLTILAMIALSPYKKAYCYNTMLCYSLGLFYSYYKDKINTILSSNKNYFILLPTLLLLFIAIRKIFSLNTIYFSIYSILFVLIIVLLTKKIKVYNCCLKWFGDNLFYVYILQRIPMMILTRVGFSKAYPYIFIIICFIATIILSFVYSIILNKADKYLFK